MEHRRKRGDRIIGGRLQSETSTLPKPANVVRPQVSVADSSRVDNDDALGSNGFGKLAHRCWNGGTPLRRAESDLHVDSKQGRLGRAKRGQLAVHGTPFLAPNCAGRLLCQSRDREGAVRLAKRSFVRPLPPGRGSAIYFRAARISWASCCFAS